MPEIEPAAALPSLPEPRHWLYPRRFSGDEAFTAEQMRSYARAAVLAERERCAKIAEDKHVAEAAAREQLGGDDIDWTMPENLGMTAVQRGFFRHGWAAVAAAIRKG